MTLEDIAKAIDRGKSARADYVVLDVLRTEILPRFFGDIDTVVGDIFWRRSNAGTLNTVPGLERYGLPGDFRHMGALGKRGSCAMAYIGDDEDLLRRYQGLAAGGTGETVITEPQGYWVELSVSVNDDKPDSPYTLVFSTKPRSVYSVDYTYYTTPDLRQAPNTIDMDKYVPFEYQHALIALGRADLISDRNGGEDPQVQANLNVYANWLKGLGSKKRGGRPQLPVYAN